MASLAAKAVAQEVIKRVGKGKVNKKEIILKNGYSKSVANSPTKVTETKSYQSEIKPLLQKLNDERNAIIERFKVTRNKAKYRDLMDGLDKTSKNIQLLTGGATEDIKIGWE